MADIHKCEKDPKVEELYIVDNIILEEWDNVVNKESKIIDEVICDASIIGQSLSLDDVKTIKLIKSGRMANSESNFYRRISLMSKLGIQWHLIINKEKENDKIDYGEQRQLITLLKPNSVRNGKLKNYFTDWVVNNKVIVISHQIIGEILSQSSKVTSYLRTKRDSLQKLNINNVREIRTPEYLNSSSHVKYELSGLFLNLFFEFLPKQDKVVEIKFESFLLLLFIYHNYEKDKLGLSESLSTISIAKHLSVLKELFLTKISIQESIEPLLQKGLIIKNKEQTTNISGGNSYIESIHITSSGIIYVDTIMANACKQSLIFNK